MENNGKTIMISRNYLGNDEELGKILIKSFIYTLTSREDYPEKILLLNSGVKLAVDKEISEDLSVLEKRGSQILICGTCLKYYQLEDEIMVGQVSNMYDISESLISGDVINI